MYTGLEDAFGDVVGKARRGQELTGPQLAAAAGLTARDVERIEAYELVPEGAAIDRLAGCLGLDAAKLRRSAAAGFFPAQPEGRPASGLEVRMLVLGTDFLMNGYIAACRQTGRGLIVDPGLQPERLLAEIEQAARQRGVVIEVVLLTHGHGDHVGALAEVLEATGATARISPGDLPLTGALGERIAGRLTPGEELTVGRQRLRVEATGGHTPGGVALVHEELAFVGDALFAGSLGGTRRRADYDRQRQAVAARLLSLPPDTSLYPGHGPATTVGEERANNPFFPAL